MSTAIADNHIVSIHYTLTDSEGTLIDSSEGSDPLNYIHGVGGIIPGLEKALAGKVEGDSVQVQVSPEEGYGEVMDELIQVIGKDSFEGVDEIEVGMTFEANTPEGQVQRIVVKAVDGDEITIDANHPLAGVQLQFDVDIVSVREASDEEMAKLAVD